MSSYLLFFGLGDFERVSRMVDGVDVGVIFKRGDAAKAAFALDAAARILPYYEEYFGVRYPLPKLDLIAGPGESQFFGAMENWGAIFYFETAVLIDPKISTEDDKRGVYITIAHEMAHQWFGDLVTMDWWDDLWLNEGFAEWMQMKATDHFHPEWHVWLDAVEQKEQALRIDSRAGTHPIIQPIMDVLQANLAFDTITYQKGQAVIRMLENFDGTDAFRDGVRLYIAKFTYRNAVTDDLWRELDKTAPRSIGDVAHDFTRQAGVPLIRVTRTASGIRLTQERFAADESGKAAQTWHVPVVQRTLGGAEWKGIVSADAPAEIALPPGAVAIVNAGQVGYFRTLYAPEALAPIAANFGKLDAADQIGLLNDTRALGYSGYEPLSDFLELAQNASPAMDPQVQTALAARLQGIGQLYRGLSGEAAYQAFAQKLLAPLLAALGWEPKPGESQNAALARNALIEALSDLQDAGTIAEAKRRFAIFVKQPSSLSGDVRHNVLQTVAVNADAAIWDQLHTLAQSTTDSLQKREYYAMLGLARDPALAKRALDLALTDEAPVTVRPSLIAATSGYNPEMAFDFVAAHFAAINAMMEPDSRNSYAPGIAGNSNYAETIPKLNAYADAHIPASARQDVTKAKAAIAYYAAIRKDRLPEVDAWLRRK